MKKIYYQIITTIFIVSLTFGTAFSFDNELTHKKLTESAIDKSQLNDILKNNLGIQNGVNEYLQNRKIRDWLREGSFLEDVPDCRASNHFHNPLNTLPWTNSGMSDSPWYINLWCSGGEYPPGNINSNVHWATDYTGPAPTGTKAKTGNQWNWDHARENYYIYLTGKNYNGDLVATTKAERESYFALSLQALGQVLHLLQDVAVPAHVRNDFKSHLDFVGITPYTIFHPTKWVGDRFEHYVKRHIKELLMGSAGGNPDDVSLTKFWDTNAYDGANPGISTSSPNKIGLAEYTNINFASKNTIFAESKPTDDVYYNPYPKKSSTDVQDYINRNKLPETVTGEDNKPDTMFYINKIGDGENITYFTTPIYLSRDLQNWDERVYYRSFEIDDKCAKNYAELLIPRAVGYSAGLLDYFFRGSLEITAPDAYTYSIIDGALEEGNTQQEFKKIRANVRNISVKDKNGLGEVISYEQMGAGQLQAVAKYKIIPDYTAELSAYPPTWEEMWGKMQGVEYSYSVSATRNIDSLSSDSAGEFEFDFSANPIPVGITDLQLFVLFKGNLGDETDNAIAVGTKNLNEPMHITAMNCTDRFYLDGQLYTANQIQNDDTLVELVDFNSNGTLNEEGEPYIDRQNIDINLAFYPGGGPFSEYAVTYTALAPGKYGRIILLIDEPQFTMAVRYTLSHNNSSILKNYSYPGVRNQFDNENDIYYFLPTSFRGIYKHYGTHYYGCYPNYTGLTDDSWPDLAEEDKEPVPADPLAPANP